MPRILYADYNATTPLGEAAKQELAVAIEVWGNPSSAHRGGRAATELLEKARRSVAQACGVDAKEVVFTSGGAEANTMALLGSFFLESPFRLLTSGVEHSSVKGACEFLKSRGAQIQTLPVDAQGNLSLEALEKALNAFRPHLVSLMAANNETGVLFPIPEIAALCAKAKVALHVDAVQAFGKVPAPFWNAADLISISAHKVYGPKGVGALIVRRGRQLVNTHFGGSQETKRRGGTQNMMGIAAFGGAAAHLAPESSLSDIAGLRDRFESRLETALEGLCIQGRGAPRVPNTSNIRVTGIGAEILMSALDLDGICVSAGSACSSGSITPSHVLLEMGLPTDAAKECLRFSWGVPTTADEIDTIATLVISHVQRIRARRQSS